MLVDPRPFTYEYRKPRFLNPTLYPCIHSANPAISTKVFTIATPSNPMTFSPKESPCAMNLTHACTDLTSSKTKNQLAISLNQRIEKPPMNYSNHHRLIEIHKKMKDIDFPPLTRLLNADSLN